MIEYTGPLKGEMVEEKVVSAKDLIEEFNLPINPKKENRILFTLDKSKITINRADGRERFGDMKMYKPLIIGSYEGQNCMIRYFKNKMPQGAGKPARYTPNRLFFQGKTHKVRTPDHLEEAVMLMLSPACGNSPFKRRNGRVDYWIDNKVEAAKKQLQSQRLLDDIRDQVLKGSDEWIQQIALGINMVYKRINSDEAKNPVLARVAILELAGKDLNFVVNTLDSVQVKIAGIAAKALEEDKIRLVSIGGARKAWYYGESYGAGEICKVAPGKDARKVLMEHLSLPEERDRFLRGLQVKDTREVRGMDDLPVEDLNEDDPNSLIDWAHKNGLINLHPGELKVYQIDTHTNEFTGRSLFNADSIDTWKSDMKASVNKIMINRLKSIVRNAQ